MHQFLPLSAIAKYEPHAKSEGVSEVARSPRGFLTAYKRAGGKPGNLSPEWLAKREAFIKRHMAQVHMRGEALWKDGEPSRRHLALIMWAYSPGLRENPEEQDKSTGEILASPQDMLDAIAHADTYGEGWTLGDFSITPLGDVSLEHIKALDDISAWVDVDPNDFAGLSVEDRLEQLVEFRGRKWVERAATWLTEGVPPIVVINAPEKESGGMHEQIGDGRGRINFALAMGWESLPAVHMQWKARPNPEALGPNELFDELVEHVQTEYPEFRCKLVVDNEKALAGRKEKRAYAACDGKKVYVATKIYDAHMDNVEGILMHELAHALLMQHGDEDHSEQDADDVAEEVFGRRISYDKNDVQTVGKGRYPRPEHLEQ